MGQLREQHRKEVTQLRDEQHVAIERVRRAKDQEVEAVVNSTNHARSVTRSHNQPACQFIVCDINDSFNAIRI